MQRRAQLNMAKAKAAGPAPLESGNAPVFPFPPGPVAGGVAATVGALPKASPPVPSSVPIFMDARARVAVSSSSTAAASSDPTERGNRYQRLNIGAVDVAGAAQQALNIAAGSSNLASNLAGNQAKARRLHNITNFELERLFTLTASPSMAAAMRSGGVHASTAAARLREAMLSQRQNHSDSYLRSDEMWDANRSGVVTVTDPADVERERLRRESEAAKEAKGARSAQALAALPVEILTESSALAGDPCAICQDDMTAGEEVRRLPCAHVFHAECIARWLPIKLMCPLDNLPVDEGIDMLAAAAGSTEAPAAPPPPPNAEAPPLPAEPAPCPPRESQKQTSQPSPAAVAAAESLSVLPAIGIRQLQSAASRAGISVTQLSDALARRRAAGITLVE